MPIDTSGSSAAESPVTPLVMTRVCSARRRGSTCSSANRRANRPVSARVSSLKIDSFTSAVDARREKSPVDDKALPGDEARGIGCQQDGGAGDLRHIAETLHRRAQQQLAAAIRLVEKLPVQVGT